MMDAPHPPEAEDNHPTVRLLHQFAKAGFPVVTVHPWQKVPRRPSGAALLLIGDDDPDWRMARGPAVFDQAALQPWFAHLAPGVVGIFGDGTAPDAYTALAAAAPAMRGGAVLVATTAEHVRPWMDLATAGAPRGKILAWQRGANSRDSEVLEFDMAKR